ncbi:hypothetical protein A2881_02565 [Candidatus Peribacteria bacterium RIFCSPHIGHO2_01_FULL_55_13]|nr:MAG: hypothetical protein A2881_02565 [Candidatus Peribacteria bacterium RIFCSPHIGHO2_01_FULL_55_13]OGJ64154.1 MAG: hypothetical protein A3F36_05175 [Candidatus Peribacteria bacterium RIFCSPHIGHO2_12_FULL_55_11]
MTSWEKADALENRCLLFAKQMRAFVRSFPNHVISFHERDQVNRSSQSIGANYIEAREAVSKDDFLYRIKICRKEAKEAAYWIDCLFDQKPFCEMPVTFFLKKEIREIISVFSAIAITTEKRIKGKNGKSQMANGK